MLALRLGPGQLGGEVSEIALHEVPGKQQREVHHHDEECQHAEMPPVIEQRQEARLLELLEKETGKLQEVLPVRVLQALADFTARQHPEQLNPILNQIAGALPRLS